MDQMHVWKRHIVLNNQLRPITTGYPKGPQASADFNNHGVCNEIPAIKGI